MLDDLALAYQPRPVAVFNLEFFTEHPTFTILAPRLARWRTLGVQARWHTIYVSHNATDWAAWPLLQQQGCLTEHRPFASFSPAELKECARLAVVWFAPRLVPRLPVPTAFPAYLPLEDVWHILETFIWETDLSLANFRRLYPYA